MAAVARASAARLLHRASGHFVSIFPCRGDEAGTRLASLASRAILHVPGKIRLPMNDSDRSDRNTGSGRNRNPHPVERAVAFLVTHRSMDPQVFGRYSWNIAIEIALLAIAYAFLVGGYTSRVSPRFDAIRSYVVILFASLLLSLVVAEAVLRMLNPMPYHTWIIATGRHVYDPDLGHVYTPNHEQIQQTREWRQVWRTNAEGIRADHDYGEKPDGVSRVLIVGDSFTTGGQVALDSAFPGVLQRLLDERFGSGSHQVINAGFPGYGTYHDLVWLKKYGLEFEPDVIVFGLTPNDLLENLRPLSVIARNGSLIQASTSEERMRQWQDRSRWYSLYGHWQRSLVKGSIDKLRSRFRTEPPYTQRRAFMVEPDDEAREQYELAEGHVWEAKQIADSIGVPFVVVTIPHRRQFSPMAEGLDPTVYGETWGAFAAEHDILYVDMYPIFRDHPDPFSLYWIEDYHCTAEGYGLIGQALFDLLVGSGVVGAPSDTPAASEAARS
jgi:hypothetical protein